MHPMSATARMTVEEFLAQPGLIDPMPVSALFA